MNKKEIVENTYSFLRKNLSGSILEELTFAKIDLMNKEGSNVNRGRIYGKTKNKIWSREWCFYEIGIGNYAASSASIGAVGFVCFADNKQCGGGVLAKAVSEIVSDFQKCSQGYKPSGVIDRHIGVHRYFQFSDTSRIQTLVDEEIKSLIEKTFDNLNRLRA